MDKYIKKYIEENISLLEKDIISFVMSIPGSIQNTEELYFVLEDAQLALPKSLKHMIAILHAYNNYSSYYTQDIFENILMQNGANPDDSGIFGFLTGMSDEQLRNTYDSIHLVIKEMLSEGEYVSAKTYRWFDL